MSFAETDFAALCARLRADADERYRVFNESLIPGKAGQSWGVRVPRLRKEAAALCKGDWRGFLDHPAVQSATVLELAMLAGIVTARAPCPEEERRRRTAAFIPRVDNWAVNDVVCASYRIPAEARQDWKDFLAPYLTSGREYEERFALVLLMDQFCTAEDLPALLSACAAVRCPGYYAQMAVAWALCTAFGKYRDDTLAFLSSDAGKALPDATFNQFVQKCRESDRVSPADKALLRAMKRPGGGLQAPKHL